MNVLFLLLLFSGTALIARRVMPHGSDRRISTRLGLCLLLLVGSRLLAGMWEPTNRYLVQTTYLSKLYLVIAFVVSLMTLLPSESAELLRRVLANRWVRRHWPMIAFIVCGVTAVYVAETDAWGYHRQIPGRLFVVNGLLLAAVMFVFFAVTNRLFFSIFAACLAFTLLVTADVVKMRYLRDAVYPHDLFLLDRRLLWRMFGIRGTVTAIGVSALSLIGLRGLWKQRAGGASNAWRTATGLAAAVLLFGVAHSAHHPIVTTALLEVGVESPQAWSPLRVARNGLLLDFLLRLNDLFMPPRQGYSEASVSSVLQRYARSSARPSASAGEERADLIVYMIESFMDPEDLGLRFTFDPIPHFRALSKHHSSGWAISPVFGGDSANAEFELLTGLATYFLPPGSIPYNRFIDRPIPSLPWLLKHYHYRSIALRADRFRYYNEQHVYPLLGLDSITSLYDSDPGVALDVSGRVPSDDAMVDAIINESRRGSPYFIFAFPESTHIPWDYPQYLRSSLDIASPHLPEEAHDELKTYLNALHTADRALGRLIGHFARSARRTVIVVLGDHLPALSIPSYLADGYAKDLGPDEIQRLHRSPILIWANFPTSKEPILCSFNYLAGRILRALGIEPTGFLALNEALAARLPVLSTYVQTARGDLLKPADVPEPDRALINDFAVIQYDVLFGRQYTLKHLGRL